MYILFAFILVCFIITLVMVIKHLYDIHLDKKQQDENFKSGNLSLSDKLEVIDKAVYIIESQDVHLLMLVFKSIFNEHRANFTYNMCINNFFMLHQKELFSFNITNETKSIFIMILNDYKKMLEDEIDNQEFNNE